MNETKTKCEIIRDLIPLACEGLCSEESQALIEEHTGECESCRMLFETVPQEEKAGEIPVPDEKETFRKVRRRFKKLSLRAWIVTVILLVILGILGYLTAGQIVRGNNMRSFDTISQNIEVRKIARYIAEGDFKHYLNTIPYHRFMFNDVQKYKAFENIEENDLRCLTETYAAAYGDTSVKKISVTSKYQDRYSAYPEDGVVGNTARITYADGRTMELVFIKTDSGRFKAGNIFDARIFFTPEVTLTDEELDFSNALAHVNDYDFLKYTLFTGNLRSKEDQRLYSGRFQPQYYDRVTKGKADFYAQGCTVEKAYTSAYRYDIDKNMLYYELVMKAERDGSTAFLETRLYYDHNGLIPPEKADISVYSDGKDTILEDALYGFFGE